MSGDGHDVDMAPAFDKRLPQLRRPLLVVRSQPQDKNLTANYSPQLRIWNGSMQTKRDLLPGFSKAGYEE